MHSRRLFKFTQLRLQLLDELAELPNPFLKKLYSGVQRLRRLIGVRHGGFEHCATYRP
jgi:hypothetical protein